MNAKNSLRPPQQSGAGNLVASGLDDNFVYPFCVWLHSLVATKSSDFDLIVGYLPKKLSSENRDFVVRFSTELGVKISLKEYDSHELFRDMRHLTSTTFLKFRISDEVSSSHLWIDLDAIGLEGWDSIYDYVNSAAESEGLVVARKLDSFATGFNAGVLGWPRGRRRPWVAALQDLPERRFSAEQGLFNLLYGETAQRVSVAFNLVSFWVDIIDAAHRPKILHFAGPSKPWHLDRKFSTQCYQHQCPWHIWFDAEAALLRKSLPNRISDELATHRRESLAHFPTAKPSKFFSIRLLRWFGGGGSTKLALFYLVQFFVTTMRVPITNLHPFHPSRKRKAKI